MYFTIVDSRMPSITIVGLLKGAGILALSVLVKQDGGLYRR